jgi:pseudouridine-5'-monophosphatase
VLVDLDGTILDTEPLYEEAMGRAIELLGKSYSWEIQKLIVGKPEHVGASIIIKELELESKVEGPEELLAHRDKFLLEMFLTVSPRKGIFQVLKYFKEKGLPIAIATSSNRRYLDLKKTSNQEVFDLIDHITCGDDPGIAKGKPSPDIYLAAAKAIGVDPQHCIVLEDSLAGLQAGKAAGALAVFVSPDSRMPKDLYGVADRIFEEWSEFLPSEHGF